MSSSNWLGRGCHIIILTCLRVNFATSANKKYHDNKIGSAKAPECIRF